MVFSKVILYICLTTIIAAYVSGQEGSGVCHPPGFPCTSDSQCCEPFICNPWAGRCTKTPSSLPPGDCIPAGAICSTAKACCEGLVCDAWKYRCIKPKTTTALPSTEAPTQASSEATEVPTETTKASSEATEVPTETTTASSEATEVPTETTKASSEAAEGSTEDSN